MYLASWQPVTLVDYPGRVAATLFTAGCNLRCPFCHNPELVLPERVSRLPRYGVDDVLSELGRRRSFLDGVVLTGGEPTLQEDLAAFIERVRELDLLVKLDTNGSRPEIVERLIERGLIDYVAVDVKAPASRYAEFAGVSGIAERVERTIRLVGRSEIEQEFRTTVAPGLGADDLAEIARWLDSARCYVLQQFRVPSETGKSLLDPSWAEREVMDEAGLRRVWASIGERFADGGVRA